MCFHEDFLVLLLSYPASRRFATKEGEGDWKWGNSIRLTTLGGEIRSKGRLSGKRVSVYLSRD